MPSDANGVHSLPNGYLAEDGETIQPSQHNPPLEDLSAGLTDRLMRSGVAPMTGPLKLANGGASAPGLSFNSDPTAGIYLEDGKIKFTKPVVGVLPIGLGPVPWSGSTAPSGWLFTGQNYLRASFPDLWLFAQGEIAAGNALYNNGNGTTTFGIASTLGRAIVERDPAGSILPNASTMGAAVGSATQQIAQNQLPNVAPSFSGQSSSVSGGTTVGGIPNQAIGGAPFPLASGGGRGFANDPNFGFISISGSVVPLGSVSSINGGVAQAALRTITPSIAARFIIFAGA